MLNMDGSPDTGEEEAYQARYHREKCPCQGRRWNPTTDLLTYAVAAWQLVTLPVKVCAEIMVSILIAFDHGENPSQKVFDVVVEALLEGEKHG